MEKVPFLDYREVLVTGGTGFLGHYVCRALVAHGYLPRLLVRAGSERRIPEDVRLASRVTPGDVTNREFVENAAQSTEAIVHLAGIVREAPEKGLSFEKAHVTATRHAVHAAKTWGIDRFVYVSALGAAAGDPRAFFDSKGRAEEMVRRSGLAWTVFRPGVLFGPGDRFVSVVAEAVRRLPAVPIPGNGDAAVQSVFAGDLARGIAESLARSDTERRVFDVGGPERFSYGGLVDRVATAFGVHARKVRIPEGAMRKADRYLGRFRGVPWIPGTLDFLLSGNTCDGGPYYSTFGFTPLSLSAYLDRMGGAGSAPPDEGFSGRGDAGPRRPGGDISSKEAA